MKTSVTLLIVACVVCLVWFYLIKPAEIGSVMPFSGLSASHDGNIDDTTKMLEREEKYLEFLDEARAIDDLLGDEPKIKRLPDTITIGVEKCGTRFLQKILSKHPKFLFNESVESQFFTFKWNESSVPDDYRQEMPESSPYHVVMERSPRYFHYVSEMLPERIKSMVPDVTIIVVLCDPVKRTISEFIQQRIWNSIPNGTDFNTFMPRIIDTNKLILAFDKNDEEAIEFIMRNSWRKPRFNLMSTGLYYYHMMRWFNVFDGNKIYVINGEELIENPGEVVEDLQEFLGVPKLVIKEDFDKDHDGFNCIRTPKVEERLGKRRVIPGTLDCLDNDNYGRTKLERDVFQRSTGILSELREFFHPFNEKLFRLLGRKFSW